MARKRREELDANLQQAAGSGPETLRWLPATDAKFTVRGLGWRPENGGSFGRMPPRAQGRVSEDVWALSRMPASVHLAFRTDATSLAVCVENADASVMPHMPGTGSDGLALYAGAAPFCRPWAVAIPDPASPRFERSLASGLERRMREYRLYLPLYKELKTLQLGFSRGTRILPPSPTRAEKPAVFYGTSITQGGCAGTAGTDYVSTLGRLLNIETINLGFSGNGRGEPVMAEFIAELDAGLFVLDYLANVDPQRLRRTLPRFVQILRQKHPETPILLLSDGGYWGYDYTERRQDMEDKRDILIEYYVGRRKRGDRNIHFVDGLSLVPFGADEAYVDGVHPTDHGFRLMAERLAPFIEQVFLRDTGG